ncbi:hypothetical protein ACIP01_05520 [Pseudomonas monteilii]|uniref:YobI family P-loop NTPase n=1 Tax=Pseudomonas monteilii TaxID=76759 RepID=UPI00381BCA2F
MTMHFVNQKRARISARKHNATTIEQDVHLSLSEERQFPTRRTALNWLHSLIMKIRDTKKFMRLGSFLSRDKAGSESFLDLAPVDNADADGLYGKALDFALNNPAIRNVALTGPYGSGKTSVIKSFEKKSPYRFLNISLATFSDPNTSTSEDFAPVAEEVTIKVERSILQQLLYGADARTLPYSRFKRITKPRWVSLNSLGFAFWIVICGYLYRQREQILAIEKLEDLKPLSFFAGLYAFSYFAQIVARSLKASHSLSVKKLSLQNGEVELDGTPESSILNKHLDEIIYFFEENDYDAVVFEDLDRFGSPEIFIKLREINKIINDRPKHKGMLHRLKSPQPLKFIYAIKDDVFFNKDRAKFFDFITPIIPIINNSNSREMFAQCVNPYQNNSGIDNRFLSEVSLYLDDYRLIKNISNEFLVYQGKVGGVPNPNKLLAIIIYKNTYPKDFEALHHGKGVLHSIVELRSELIEKASTANEGRIETLRNLILESEAEMCLAQEDLTQIFWGQLCGGTPNLFISGVYAGSELLTLESLKDWNNFKKLFNENPIRIHGIPVQQSYYHISTTQVPLGISFRELEAKATPKAKFEDRFERIKNKHLQRRNKINLDISSLKEQQSELARQPLKHLLANATLEIDTKISSSGIADPRLLKYLIKNGYLDETYNLYISIFHEGRMSRNDWNFIQTIRDFRPLAPDAQIDNPREIIAEMRDEDFGAEYVLNVAIIDFLLSSSAINSSKVRSALEFIARHFTETSDFFRAYWLSGRNIDGLTKKLSESWTNYAVASIGSDQAPRHIAHILAYVDPSYVAMQMNSSNALAKYIETHSALIFSENAPVTSGYHALKQMSVKLTSLHEISAFDELADYACKNSLYLINPENIEFALTKLSSTTKDNTDKKTDPRLANFTAISSATNDTIYNYIWENIDDYLKNVAIALQDNTEETEQSILKIANHPDLDTVLALEYISRQNHTFESFENIPKTMQEELLFCGKILITWENILQYHRSEAPDLSRLSHLLNQESVVTKLVNSKIPKTENEDTDGKALCWFIISNISISISNFEKLCKCVQYFYIGFPSDMPAERKLLLAQIGKIELNEKTFAAATDPLLAATLINSNLPSYLKHLEKYPANIETKLTLLHLSPDKNRATIVKLITLEELQADVAATNQVAKYLSTENLTINEYKNEVVSHCLTHSSDNSAKLDILYNFIDLLSNEEIKEALSASQEPYCQFVKANTRQKLPNTEKHRSFAKKLVAREIISSTTQDGAYIRINAYRKGLTKLILGDS